MIGTIVKVIVDRPLGTYHPKHKDIYYSVNYGYIPGVMAPDGEEQDAYILGVSQPVEEFVGKVVAIIHRYDDVEEKWVVAPDGMSFTKEEIIDDKVSNAQVILGKDNLWIILGKENAKSDFSNFFNIIFILFAILFYYFFFKTFSC